MHLTYLVIFALLSFVGAAPTNNLEHDLREAAEDAQILINKDEIETMITLAKSIVSHNIAPKKEIDQWQSYSDKLSTWNVIFTRDYAQLEQTEIPHNSYAKFDQYTNGEYSKLKSNFLARRAQRYSTFKVNALEIVESAEKAGITHILLDKKSTLLDKSSEEFFDEMILCLYRKL
ncbi:uncharacterized protein LOC133850304 [Drosophila sulfurigaster albostrigata]|uniref:uncharacterized protein LOC133850304 n=1 Tax=Drosophila sulfurigaster albostrigata TaxID=89887 RepID=UPI002D21AB33|nr:uncharacterized protein LOC133850304 [Drosophila sulfurigaster albostrigata]